MEKEELKKPKGYFFTKLYFSKKESAEQFIKNLNKEFLLKKAQALEYPSSKKRIKLIKFAKPKKYLITKQGSRFLLWEEI